MGRIGELRAGLLAVMLLSGFAASAHAQSCHPLEGTWTLNAASSQVGPPLSFNPYYRVDAVRLRLYTQGQRIYQEWFFSGPHLNEHWNYAFVADGHSYPTAAHSMVYSVPASLSAEWQNCTLIVHGLSSLFGRTISIENVYVFSADGATLTILQTGGSSMLHIDRTLVFQR